MYIYHEDSQMQLKAPEVCGPLSFCYKCCSQRSRINFSEKQQKTFTSSLETTGFMGNVVLLLRRTNFNQTTDMRGGRQQIYTVTSCVFFLLNSVIIVISTPRLNANVQFLQPHINMATAWIKNSEILKVLQSALASSLLHYTQNDCKGANQFITK